MKELMDRLDDKEIAFLADAIKEAVTAKDAPSKHKAVEDSRGFPRRERPKSISFTFRVSLE